jgi:hypothetical protein
MAISTDRSAAIRGSSIRLKIQYYDVDSNPLDPDETPSVKIINSVGEIEYGPSSVQVNKESTGLYYFDYKIDKTDNEGLYQDYWEAAVDSAPLYNYFSFLVLDAGDLSDATGTVRLGDEVDFDFSDEELAGVNILLKYLKTRLRSEGRKPVRDKFGAFVESGYGYGYGDYLYEECNVFSDEILACFLCQALSEFNMVPFFTKYSFANKEIQTTFSSLIVEGAYVVALASQSLVEKGRDFTISDGGISYQPPQLGDFLSSHYSNWLSQYRERLKFIKNNIRPGPNGFGTFTNLTSGAPAVSRLRHLRSRKII